MNSKFVIRNCDYCSSDKYSTLFKAPDHYFCNPGEYTIVRCSNCGLVYTNPAIKADEIANFYKDDIGYYKPEKNYESLSISTKLVKKLLGYYFGYPISNVSSFEKIILWPLYQLVKSDLKSIGYPDYVEGGTLLEIGCSYGRFLNKMKSLGWRVEGIDMNAKAVEYAKNELGLNVSQSTIETFSAKRKYDVILMRMVLEHVYSPKETLRSIRKLLKPGGVLIVNVPNFDGLEMQLFKSFAYGLQVPVHYTHFTPLTLKRYLEQSKFHVEFVSFQTTDRDFVAPLHYLSLAGRLPKSLLMLATEKHVRKFIIKPGVFALAKLRCTSRMTVHATTSTK